MIKVSFKYLAVNPEKLPLRKFWRFVCKSKTVLKLVNQQDPLELNPSPSPQSWKTEAFLFQRGLFKESSLPGSPGNTAQWPMVTSRGLF
jgi:hypothetical protein